MCVGLSPLGSLTWYGRKISGKSCNQCSYLGVSSVMVASPYRMAKISFLDNSISLMNVDSVQSLDMCSCPPSFGNMGKFSLRDVVQSSSNCLMVHEALTISILMVKYVLSKETIYSSTSLICQSISLWSRLVNLHQWISNPWKLKIEG
jgi:hypothetical protein